MLRMPAASSGLPSSLWPSSALWPSCSMQAAEVLAPCRGQHQHCSEEHPCREVQGCQPAVSCKHVLVDSLQASQDSA